MRCLVLLVFVLAGSIAYADPSVTPLARSCAEVSGANLTPEAQAHAQEVFARVLEKADLFVVDRDCTDVYRIEQAGDEVVLTGPRGSVRGSLRDRGWPGEVYAALVEQHGRVMNAATSPAAVVAAAPDVFYAPPAAAVEATDEQPTSTSTAERVRSLFYMRLGFGTVNVPAGDGTGGSVGFGTRFPVRPTVAVDLSLNFTGGVAAGGKALVMSQPPAGSTGLYGGAGLSATKVSSFEGSGGGVAAELAAGVAVVPSHRAFVQADLTVPFYLIGGAYPAMFVLSVGFGFAGR